MTHKFQYGDVVMNRQIELYYINFLSCAYINVNRIGVVCDNRRDKVELEDGVNKYNVPIEDCILLESAKSQAMGIIQNKSGSKFIPDGFAKLIYKIHKLLCEAGL